MTNARILFMAVALATFPGIVCAQTSGAWVRNPVTHYYAWNSSDEPNRTFTWSGDCQSNIAEGRGVMQWFTNGIPSGRYLGEYGNGRMTGRGILEYPNGDTYEGEFRDDKPNGGGSYRSHDGRRSYTGLVRNGSPVQGEATIGSGQAYKGAFRDGQPVRGKTRYPDGSAYEGSLRDNKPSGYGVFTSASGGRYEGEFADGKPNGFGTYVAADGAAYAGLWTKGCFQQRGRTVTVLTIETGCTFRPRSRLEIDGT